MKKRIKLLLISFIMFFCITLTVNANTADLTNKGSIEITLKEGTDNWINDAEITIYHIADAIEINNNLAYSLRSELSDCDVSLDNLEDTNLVNEISKCNLDDVIKYIGTTDINGIVKYNNLDLGLYLIKQTKSVKGYSNIDPFLFALPKVEDGHWTYHTKAKPKTDIYKVIDLIVEKKWNTDNKDLPNEVTIELYNDNVLLDTIKLNENNNWTYTFKDLQQSDKYTVKEINVPKGYTPSYKVNDYLFTITNTDTLATTGQIFYPIIILIVLGIVLILTGIRIIKNEA